ncbi:hypothetical protein KFL_007120010, partial [Klebsormidium nitens]
KRQTYVAKLPGGKRARTEADKERAREYEKTPARKASKLARKEANPERWAQYSKDSRARRRAADPEGYLAKAAADQMRFRNRTRQISFEGEEGSMEQTTAAQIIEEMDSCCFFCGEAHTNEKPLGVHRLDTSGDWTVDNCVPACTLCWNMKRKVDAKTFVERCAHIAAITNGGGVSVFPADIFGDHPGAGEYNGYQCSARKRGIPFELSPSDFQEKLAGDCYICGKANSATHNNGLDRVDSSLGYTFDNVRTACGDCNYMKADTGIDKFLEQVVKIEKRAAITLQYIPKDIKRSTFVLQRN